MSICLILADKVLSLSYNVNFLSLSLFCYVFPQATTSRRPPHLREPRAVAYERVDYSLVHANKFHIKFETSQYNNPAQKVFIFIKYSYGDLFAIDIVKARTCISTSKKI